MLGTSLLLAAVLAASQSAHTLHPRRAELDRHFAERAAQLQWVRGADPVADAERALAAGDTRILGVREYSVRFPGFVLGFYPHEGCSWRAIEGTGDFLNQELRELQELAAAYAATYNERVLHASGCRNEPYQP